MQEINRKIVLDGNAAIIEFGFVPDKVEMHIDDLTNVDITRYFKQLEDDDSIYGYLLTGSSGVVTRLTSAATGISSYDTAIGKVMLPAPNGEGEQAATLPIAFVAGTTQPTPRSTTVLGTVVKPSQSKLTGYIYECTAAVGVYGTEPTAWPTVPGETISDGTNTWICREEKIKAVGVKGITIGASVANNTDGLIAQIIATRFDKDPLEVDAGGVVADAPV
jgi:hypothetical protein